MRAVLRSSDSGPNGPLGGVQLAAPARSDWTIDNPSCNDSAVGARGILYWMRDDGHLDDLGRAWVIEADGSERPINSGDPISRAEAERLAEVGGYTLDAEDMPLTRDTPD
jgi:hypothetical protein